MKKIIFLFILFFSLSFYGQDEPMAVIRHTDSSMVVQKDSKIVYRGIPNPLTIEVPNSKSFTVQAPGLTKISANRYNVNPGAGTELMITVDVVLKNNKKATEKHVFEIKNTSHFITTINGNGGAVRMQKKHFKDAVIRFRFVDKNLNLVNTVVGFDLKIPGQPSLRITGNKIDEKTYEKILKYASLGDQIVISDVRARTNLQATCILIPPLVIEIY